MAGGAELLFGKIAVKLGYLSSEDLEETVHQQVKSNPPVSLGFLLVKKNLLSQDQIDEILGIQKANTKTAGLFGKLVVNQDLVPQRNVNECLRDQELFKRKGYDFKLGELLVKKGYLDSGMMDQVLALQNKQMMMCGGCFTTHNVDLPADGDIRCDRCGGRLAAKQASNGA